MNAEAFFADFDNRESPGRPRQNGNRPGPDDFPNVKTPRGATAADTGPKFEIVARLYASGRTLGDKLIMTAASVAACRTNCNALIKRAARREKQLEAYFNKPQAWDTDRVPTYDEHDDDLPQFIIDSLYND